MKFNLDNYKGKYAMHCKTAAEAKSFCRYLHEHGKTWRSGDSYISKTNYGKYKVYDFNCGEYGDIAWFQHNNYTILEWADFMHSEFYKDNFRTGDVIQRRDGKIGIVNAYLETIVFKDGWDDLNNFHYDLTSTCNFDELDIMAVRRPNDKCDCNFNAFKYKQGTLVYEREEPVEMTLAEVCKLLGKNIKIIK